ncbi:MAG: hypothetical protein ACRD8O_07515, partial [Bryobacteraceae bacterium]
ARLLFISDHSGTLDLYSIAVREGKAQGLQALLKKDIGRVTGAGIADNGSLHYSINTALGDVYLGDLDIDAGAIRNLRQIDQPAGHLSFATQWSPDGKQLFIQRRAPQESRSANFIRDVATGVERAYKTPYDALAVRGQWTADGKSVLLMLVNETSVRLVLADADTWKVRGSFDVPGQRPLFFGPNSAPGGEFVFFAKGNVRTRDTRLVRIRLQTGEEKEVCRAVPMGWAVSPDGTQAACSGFTNSIRIVPTAGGEGRDLVKTITIAPMAWTPDGKHLIYTQGRGPVSYWIVPIAGGQPRKLDVAFDLPGEISIHPDGRRIAITSRVSTTELWVMENLKLN